MDEEISGSLMSVMFRMNVTTDEWLLSQGELVHEIELVWLKLSLSPKDTTHGISSIILPAAVYLHCAHSKPRQPFRNSVQIEK